MEAELHSPVLAPLRGRDASSRRRRKGFPADASPTVVPAMLRPRRGYGCGFRGPSMRLPLFTPFGWLWTVAGIYLL